MNSCVTEANWKGFLTDFISKAFQRLFSQLAFIHNFFSMETLTVFATLTSCLQPACLSHVNTTIKQKLTFTVRHWGCCFDCFSEIFLFLPCQLWVITAFKELRKDNMIIRLNIKQYSYLKNIFLIVFFHIYNFMHCTFDIFFEWLVTPAEQRRNKWRYLPC